MASGSIKVRAARADRENVYLVHHDGTLNIQDTNRLMNIVGDFYVDVLAGAMGPQLLPVPLELQSPFPPISLLSCTFFKNLT